MSSYWIVVSVSLSAALVFAGSTSLKHVSAARVPDAQDLGRRNVGRFIRATITHRLWLAGIGCDVVGLALQVVALHLGALSLVQPLLLTSLLFALLMRARFERHRISRGQFLWALALIASLGGFVLLAAPPIAPAAGSAARVPAGIAGALGTLIVLACLVLGRRLRSRDGAAAILGVGVGVIYAATAALIKTATDIGARNPVDLLGSWQLYAVVVVGGLGLLLSQLTFQAGPLAASLPATATVDPLLSIVVGVFVFREQIHRGLGTHLALAGLLALLAVAVVQLTRRSAGSPESPDSPESSGTLWSSDSPESSSTLWSPRRSR